MSILMVSTHHPMLLKYIKKYDAKKWIELIEYYETRRNLILGLKTHINNLLEIRRLTNHI